VPKVTADWLLQDLVRIDGREEPRSILAVMMTLGAGIVPPYASTSVSGMYVAARRKRATFRGLAMEQSPYTALCRQPKANSMLQPRKAQAAFGGHTRVSQL
jgi:hypothetical protein